MKKRFFALGGILVLVLSFGLLAGCSTGEGAPYCGYWLWRHLQSASLLNADL